jgi:hypothetical protein
MRLENCGLCPTMKSGVCVHLQYCVVSDYEGPHKTETCYCANHKYYKNVYLVCLGADKDTSWCDLNNAWFNRNFCTSQKQLRDKPSNWQNQDMVLCSLDRTNCTIHSTHQVAVIDKLGAMMVRWLAGENWLNSEKTILQCDFIHQNSCIEHETLL